jgi:2',5'-phosphodiesterase
MDTVRIVTYNLLSSHLPQPDHFKYCRPADLAADTRFRLIQEKIEAETRRQAIICLQEVSQLWAGPLHAFFQQRRYHFVTALYGNARNGYMGVGLAWPNDLYEAPAVAIQRLADTRQWSSPGPHIVVRAARDAAARLASAWWQGLRLLGIEHFDPWAVAQARANEIIVVRLCSRQTQSIFHVATYHMPCLYGSAKKRQTMLIHASLAAQYVQGKAADEPYIIAGDFNFVPGSSSYRLLTEGKWDVEHEDFPFRRANDDTDWDANNVQRVTSAYVLKNGREPDFTNNARVGEEPPFIETLDYIFLSSHWSVQEVVALPGRDAIEGPFPNALEPSDHMLIGANLSLPHHVG